MRDWTLAFADSPRYLFDVAAIIERYDDTEIQWGEDGEGNEYIEYVYWQGDTVYAYDEDSPSDTRRNFPRGLVKKLDDWAKGAAKTFVGQAAKLPLP